MPIEPTIAHKIIAHEIYSSPEGVYLDLITETSKKLHFLISDKNTRNAVEVLLTTYLSITENLSFREIIEILASHGEFIIYQQGTKYLLPPTWKPLTWLELMLTPTNSQRAFLQAVCNFATRNTSPNDRNYDDYQSSSDMFNNATKRAFLNEEDAENFCKKALELFNHNEDWQSEYKDAIDRLDDWFDLQNETYDEEDL